MVTPDYYLVTLYIQQQKTPNLFAWSWYKDESPVADIAAVMQVAE